MLCYVLWICFSFTTALQDGGYILEVEHAIGQGDFTKRSEIYFPNLKGQDAVIQNQKPLTKDDLEELVKVSHGNGFYRIRVPTKLQEQNNNVSWTSSFMHAKKLLITHLSDHIHVHTDGTGNIISVSITTVSKAGATYLYDLDPELDSLEFITTLNVSSPSQAAVPDTQGFLNKLEEEKRKKEIEAKEPQSFFGKYWMFIVPVMLFMMMSNAAPQQQ